MKDYEGESMRQGTKRIFVVLGIGVGVIATIGILILDLVGVRYGMRGMILIVDGIKGFQSLCGVVRGMVK